MTEDAGSSPTAIVPANRRVPAVAASIDACTRTTFILAIDRRTPDILAGIDGGNGIASALGVIRVFNAQHRTILNVVFVIAGIGERLGTGQGAYHQQAHCNEQQDPYQSAWEFHFCTLLLIMNLIFVRLGSAPPRLLAPASGLDPIRLPGGRQPEPHRSDLAVHTAAQSPHKAGQFLLHWRDRTRPPGAGITELWCSRPSSKRQ